MKGSIRELSIAAVMSLAVLACLALFSGRTVTDTADGEAADKERRPDSSRYVVAVEDDAETWDFQCTTINYTVAINVFDRLVETEISHDGVMSIRPSLAESWEVSEDGLVYSFHLRDDVRFSNGSALTSSDVLYTFRRLLTCPGSVNQDVALMIAGAEELARGKTDRLEGFEIKNDRDFSITLEEPYEACLACLSMPGASILDAETTEAVGERFGMDAESTIGTGPYILSKWERGRGMLLTANPDCWSGPPRNEGMDLRFLGEPEEIRRMFDAGEIDVLDIDEVKYWAEYYYRGDIYQDRQYRVQRICTQYIALNESVKPLSDVRVRKAMQLALNRPLLLDAVYSGRGRVENGIYPYGLYGFNPNLAEIPYDVEEAASLLAEAGYPDGFDLEVSVKSSSTQFEMDLIRLAAAMWARVGIRAHINVLDEPEFLKRRMEGGLACYTAMWTADFDDPDNFIYTFFGNRENTRFRSLCYPDEEVMAQVRAARRISDKKTRIKEYRDLEIKLIQEDAAWIPLFSRQYVYVTSDRVRHVQSAWNGSVKTKYRDISVKDAQ